MRIRTTLTAAVFTAGWLLIGSGLWAQELPAEIPSPEAAPAAALPMETAPAQIEVTVKLADEELQAAVVDALRNDTFTFPYVLIVSAADGKVTLRGKVDTEIAKARVEQVVAAVGGVTDIENLLTLNPNLFAKTDLQIKRAVEEELAWSPLVRNRQIIVQVADGVVTLHGEVKDLCAWHSASANALQGGAKKVVNKLTIKPSPNMSLPSPWLSLREETR